MGNKLIDAAKQEGKDLFAEDILSQLEQADPTPHKQFLQWLANQYVANQFRLEDYPQIKEELSQFQILARRNKLDQKDINRYSYYSLSDAIEKAIGSVGITKSTHDLTDCKVLYNGPLGILAIPQSEAAAKELGKGTKWCTAANENNMYNHYSSTGDLFVWVDKSGEKYQFWFEGYKDGKLNKLDNIQLMDSKDRAITDEKWKELKQIIPVAQLVKKLSEVILTNATASSLYYYAQYVVKDRWPEVEPYIAKDPQAAYLYARNVIKGRWPEAEPYIMKDPEWAYYYVCEIIKDRWPEAEPYIAKDPSWAYLYTIDAIRDRWPEAEPNIAKDPKYACCYARIIFKDKWPEAEPLIMKDPEWAYYYAQNVIKDRWPEAEPYIIKSPQVAYYYAQFVIRDRWLEAEPYIMKDPKYAYLYARDVIKNRWPEAEPYIVKDSVNWIAYKKCFDINIP